MTARARRRAAALAAASVLTLAGCAATSDASPPATTGPVETLDAELSGELIVFAAASLTGAFDELAARFEQRHPSLDVLPISYDGSSVLATQLLEGASADVFASADERNLAKVRDAGLAGAGAVCATNTLQIAVAPGDPKGIRDLEALADPRLAVVLCAPEVPCGSAARALLDDAGVSLAPESEEQNVSAVLAKVRSGEADAGLVYRTDVLAAEGDVTGVDIDGADAATNAYPLVALDDAPNPEAAAAFVDFVLSDAGQQVLEDFGFGAP